MKNSKFYISNSAINMFNSCPRKFKLNHIDKVGRNYRLNNKYISFDTSIHSAMAKLNTLTGINELHEGRIKSIIEDSWVDLGYSSYDEEQVFKDRAYRMLLEYIDAPKDVGAENLITNRIVDFTFENGSIVSAKVDKVYERFDSKIEVVDYKTGYTINKRLDFHSNYQLPLYLTLVHNKLGIYPDFISYYYLAYNKKFTYEVTQYDIDIATLCLEQLIHQIRRTESYRCSPTPYCKNYCEHYKICKL